VLGKERLGWGVWAQSHPAHTDPRQQGTALEMVGAGGSESPAFLADYHSSKT